MMNFQVPLPSFITVGGTNYSIYTDFNTWIRFSKETNDFRFIFKNSHPCFRHENKWAISQNTYDELLAFYFAEKNSDDTEENGSEESQERLFDFELDAEYIYSAFLQAYGIDLFESNMHWHKFRALLLSLPKDTLMSEIMGYRAYKGNDKEFKKLKSKWALPKIYTEEEKQMLDDFERRWK